MNQEKVVTCLERYPNCYRLICEYNSKDIKESVLEKYAKLAYDTIEINDIDLLINKLIEIKNKKQTNIGYDVAKFVLNSFLSHKNDKQEDKNDKPIKQEDKNDKQEDKPIKQEDKTVNDIAKFVLNSVLSHLNDKNDKQEDKPIKQEDKTVNNVGTNILQLMLNKVLSNIDNKNDDKNMERLESLIDNVNKDNVLNNAGVISDDLLDEILNDDKY